GKRHIADLVGRGSRSEVREVDFARRSRNGEPFGADPLADSVVSRQDLWKRHLGLPQPNVSFLVRRLLAYGRISRRFLSGLDRYANLDRTVAVLIDLA